MFDIGPIFFQRGYIKTAFYVSMGTFYRNFFHEKLMIFQNFWTLLERLSASVRMFSAKLSGPFSKHFRGVWENHSICRNQQLRGRQLFMKKFFFVTLGYFRHKAEDFFYRVVKSAFCVCLGKF